MGKLAKRLAASTKTRLIAWGQLVYRVVRVDSDDLRRVGYATLEGAASVRECDRELRTLRHETQLKMAQLKGEELEAARKLAAEREAAILEQRALQLLGRPEGQVSLLDRYDAYICSAITGVGRLLETTELEPKPEHPLGVVVDADDPSLVLEDLRDEAQIKAGLPPIYIEEIRYVQSAKDQDPDKGRIWVHALSEEERRLLGGAISVLQSVTGDLVPFRLQSRGPVDPGEAGGGVQQAAPRDPAAVAGGSGAGDLVSGGAPGAPGGGHQGSQGVANV